MCHRFFAAAMSNSFRIDASELAGWHAIVARKMDVRGVAAIAKELEAHVAKKEADGTVVVSRHQLFTWAEALSGAASRPGGAELAPVAADMRGILSGKPAGAATPAPAPAFAPPSFQSVAPTMFTGAAPPTGYQAPAPVQYAPAPVSYGTSASSGGVRIVAGPELAELARDLVRSAKGELFVSSPWDMGVETLAQEIAMLPPAVKVLIVSRRPANETPAYHDAMNALGKRRTVTAYSPYIQTRLIVQDNERALVGAASVPGPQSREAAVLLTDRAAVAAVRAHFERMHNEAAGPRP
jgi:hypothetical protein